MDSKIDIWESCVEEDNSETSWNYGCQFKKAGLKNVWNDTQATKIKL